IRLKASFHTVQVQFENWGTPIEEFEITSGAIFRRGYRGRYAEHEGIPGTGTGLADAKDIIESMHRGQLVVESRVDRRSRGRQGYPNITTVTAFLPRCG